MNNYLQNTVTKTGTYTATLLDYAIRCDATSASFSVTLPAAATCTGLILNIKKIDSTANTVTLQGNAAELIDGTNTKVLSAQYASYQIQSNGTSWDIL